MLSEKSLHQPMWVNIHPSRSPTPSLNLIWDLGSFTKMMQVYTLDIFTIGCKNMTAVSMAPNSRSQAPILDRPGSSNHAIGWKSMTLYSQDLFVLALWILPPWAEGCTAVSIAPNSHDNPAIPYQSTPDVCVYVITILSLQRCWHFCLPTVILVKRYSRGCCVWRTGSGWSHGSLQVIALPLPPSSSWWAWSGR